MSRQFDYALLGTKCSSCELTIEDSISGIEGVESVDASHARGALRIIVSDETRINPKVISRLLKPHGYRIAAPNEAAPSRPRHKIGSAFALIVGFAILAKFTGISNIGTATGSPAGLLAVFGIGIVAAFSTCTAMLAGLVAGLSASSSGTTDRTESIGARMRPHLWFNAGRIIGYAGFGAAVGALGSVIALDPALNAVFVLLVAVVMVAMGLNLLDLVPAWLPLRPPKSISRKIAAMRDSRRPGMPFALGALTFFLPCGFTQSMQLYALSLGSPLEAALVMTVFALGTAPALLGVGLATTATGTKWRTRMARAAGAFVVVLGVGSAQNATALLGVDVSVGNKAENAVAASLANGSQTINMEITRDFTYAPDAFTVVEGVPVTWNIYGSSWMGCADTLILRQFGVDVRLRPGFNKVTFTPNRPGTYTFSCSMGMIRGTMVVLPADAS